MPRRKKSFVVEQFDKERWETFGKWMVDERTGPHNHLSQEKAADLIGISRPYLSQIENGKRSVPVETVKKIDKGLNCPEEVALYQARYTVKEGTLDEKAYLSRILNDLRSDNLQYAINDLILLYDLINIRKRKRRVFALGPTCNQVAQVIFLLHELPAWVRSEVLNYFNKIQDQAATQDAPISPARKSEAIEEIKSEIQDREKR
jgi:transcriptional regulator with XRE-family HTH domain